MTSKLDDVLVAQARFDTPLGTMTAAATARGLAGLWFDGQRHHPGPLAAAVDHDNRHIAQARQELAAWFTDGAARCRGFTVPLDAQGTTFQRGVWARLSMLACGEQSRYGEIARALGRPEAARAVGAAIGRNPISVIVPCHRVLGHDGALTGYAGGLERKRALLALEAEHRREGRAGHPAALTAGVMASAVTPAMTPNATDAPAPA